MVVRHNARGGTEDNPADIWKSTSQKAKETREETIRLLAIFVANLQAAFDPDVIVLGGGLSNLPLVKPVNKLLPKYLAKPILKQNKFGVDASIIGATVALQ